jgi:hypothetical protein
VSSTLFGAEPTTLSLIGRAVRAQKQKPRLFRAGVLLVGEPDDYLLSHGQSALSSAWSRFTVLFGMGRGGTDSLWSSGMTGCCVAGSAPQPIWKKRKEVFADWGCVVSGTTRDLSTPCVKHTGYRIKPYGQLVSVSLTHYCASTPDLSTSWSRTTLQGDQVPGEVSS